MRNQGPFLALFSAILFGVSTPITKLIIGDMSPFLLAGLLYLGSGGVLLLTLRISAQHSLSDLAKLSPKHRWKLAGAVISGGIIAPLFLAFGIKLATAFEVSVLLNLETVATTVIAWLIFREHIGRSVWWGKALILFGGVLITLGPTTGAMFSVPGLLVLGACLFWGIDNNLTRDVDELSPVVLAGVKGVIAGSFNIALAFLFGHGTMGIGQGGATLILGAFSYGLSLVLFIRSLRAIGSSRTSTYFASAPFFGMLVAVILLGERPTIYQWVAAAIMAMGLWILSREDHEHVHSHEPLTHTHAHSHDEHHQHLHEGTEGSGPHEHVHTHEPITHSHPHFPDIHHRHRH